MIKKKLKISNCSIIVLIKMIFINKKWINWKEWNKNKNKFDNFKLNKKRKKSNDNKNWKDYEKLKNNKRFKSRKEEKFWLKRKNY